MEQISNFGRMLDPIADKVMVMIALLVVVSFSQMDAFILIPVVVIFFREIFVSGLREFLGADAGRLQVTKLAKWKTTVQMVAIAAILLTNMLGVYVSTNSFAMEQTYAWQVMMGEVQDDSNLYVLYQSYVYVGNTGVILIWLAALLTFITGFDYFRKALPFLKEET